MFIKSIEKEVEVAVRTRKISRQINEAMLKDVIVTDGEATHIPAINASVAEELTVKLLCGLSQEELDKLEDADYELLKKEISKKK